MNSRLYQYLFLGIVLFYAVFLSQFGFENWDTGYITSFSWRIVNGEQPYHDFMYKGPPVTLYLHAFWLYVLPDAGEYYFVRIVNYLMFALQIFFTVSAFDKLYDFTKLGFNKYGLMSLGFVVALLNFPAFPWPTTDGLLFASLALFIVAQFKRIGFTRLAAVALCCVLSALTKQSFYLVPLLFTGWILVAHGWRKAVYFILFTLSFIALYVFFILQITTWQQYIDLTTGETNLQGLLYVGFHEYKAIFYNWWFTLPVVAVTAIMVWIKPGKKSTRLLMWLPLVIMAAAVLLCLFNEIRIASRVAFVSIAMLVVFQLLSRRSTIKQLAPVAVVLGIAWSASISFGYSYPIFYSGGLIASFVALAHAELCLPMRKKYIIAVALIIGIIAVTNNYRPYREQPIPQLTYSMASVSPKLKYTKTHRENLQKHLELRQLVMNYGPDFIVAPAIPAANYLFDQQSNLPADWIINTEVNRQFDLFVKLAAARENYIFLEKSYLRGEEMSMLDKRKTSEITWQIHTRFRKIAETEHFIIYNGIR